MNLPFNEITVLLLIEDKMTIQMIKKIIRYKKEYRVFSPKYIKPR
jgi:hypothetical protein